MTIDWENLKKEDLFDRKLYESISNIQDSFERLRQEESLLGVAKKFNIKGKVKPLYEKIKEQSDFENTGRSIIDFGEKAPIRKMEAPGYYKDSKGHIRVKEKNTLVTTTLLQPIAILKNYETGEELVKCAFLSREKWSTFIINREVIVNNGKITRLANKGIDVTSDSSKLLVGFIRDLLNNNELEEVQSTSKMGWHEGDFLPYGKSIEFDGEESFSEAFKSLHSKGDYEKWYDEIHKCRDNNVPLKLIMAASFASPLLYLLGRQSFATLLWGKSGGKKTVAGRIAMSIWGDSREGKLMFSMNNTTNFYFRTAEFFNHLPVFFDEFQTFVKQGGNMDKLIMSLTEGIDRGKADIDGGIQRSKTWKNIFLFTGEQSISDINSGGGTLNRLIEIYITKDVVEDGIKTCDVLNENYGHAGKIYIDYIKQIPIEKLREMFLEKLQNIKDLNITEEKQAINMAMLLLADDLACKCVFKEEYPLKVEETIQYMFTKNEIDNSERAYQDFLDFCDMNKSKFNPENQKFAEFWGTIDEFEISIITKKFRNVIKEAGFNPTKILREWEEKGLVEKNSSGRYSTKLIRGGIPANYTIVKIRKKEENE